MITEAARDRFDRTIQAAVEAGARVLAGGTPLRGPGLVLRADGARGRDARARGGLAGAFGPVILVRGVADADAAVAAANASGFGPGRERLGPHRRAARAAGPPAPGRAWSRSTRPSPPRPHASAPFGGLQGQRIRPDPRRARASANSPRPRSSSTAGRAASGLSSSRTPGPRRRAVPRVLLPDVPPRG